MPTADDPLPQAVARVEQAIRIQGDDFYQRDLRLILAALHAAREDAARLTCKLCGGTGRKVIGEHETLTNEWVSDYGPCDHDAARAANQEGT